MRNDSVVKIPDGVNRNSKQTINTVTWTAQLDDIFRRNRHEDKTLRLE